MLSRLSSSVSAVRWTRFISFEWLAKISLPSLDLQDFTDTVASAPTRPQLSIRRRSRDLKVIGHGAPLT